MQGVVALLSWSVEFPVHGWHAPWLLDGVVKPAVQLTHGVEGSRS